MKLTTRKLNTFLFFKLPSAFISGVRVKLINEQKCEVDVTHKWINQNPFKSMYFAVQAMAAELSTGALVIKFIQEKDLKVSMLVAQNKAVFSKKATGKIKFTCSQGAEVEQLIDSLKITWWIGTPLYFVIGGTACFIQIIFIAFFAALWDNYNNKGIIKVGIKKPKFINKLLNIKD